MMMMKKRRKWKKRRNSRVKEWKKAHIHCMHSSRNIFGTQTEQAAAAAKAYILRNFILNDGLFSMRNEKAKKKLCIVFILLSICRWFRSVWFRFDFRLFLTGPHSCCVCVCVCLECFYFECGFFNSMNDTAMVNMLFDTRYNLQREKDRQTNLPHIVHLKANRMKRPPILNCRN